jgi:5-methyltetrahydropteroyltriglutamate--homocysteine methyltransferase
MNEIETTWRWPRVVGKVEHDPKNPLEYAKLWRIAQARAGKPVKFGTCSSQVLAIFLDSHTSEYDLDDKKQLIWDMATAMNIELRQLAAAGAKVIQIEEPTIHFTPAFHPRRRSCSTSWSTPSTTRSRARRRRALDPHLLGQPNMQKVYSGESYANSIDIYLNRLQGRRLDGRGDRERAGRDRPVQAVRREPAKKVAVGVVSHRQLQADMAPSSRRVRRALEVIPADKLICRATAASGGRASTGPSRSTRRRASRRAGTSSSRSSVWSRATSPAADPALQTDVLPDREPLTHLPSPWQEVDPLGLTVGHPSLGTAVADHEKGASWESACPARR